MVRSIQRHPLVTFFLLAFALTWVVWVPRSAGVPVGAVGQAWTWIPAIAALLAAALTGGRAAVGDLGAHLVRWRVGWRWYVVVIFGPALFSIAVAGACVLLGAPGRPQCRRRSAVGPPWCRCLCSCWYCPSRTVWAKSLPGGVLLSPAAPLRAQRARGKPDPWRALGAVAPPVVLDGRGHALPTAPLAAPHGHNGEVYPLHLGLPAHARERASRHSLSCFDQPVRGVAGWGSGRWFGAPPARRREVGAGSGNHRSSRACPCKGSATRGAVEGLSREVYSP